MPSDNSHLDPSVKSSCPSARLSSSDSSAPEPQDLMDYVIHSYTSVTRHAVAFCRTVALQSQTNHWVSDLHVPFHPIFHHILRQGQHAESIKTLMMLLRTSVKRSSPRMLMSTWTWQEHSVCRLKPCTIIWPKPHEGIALASSSVPCESVTLTNKRHKIVVK